MKARLFGHTKGAVGEGGLGTRQIGGNWGDVSDASALGTLRAAVEPGSTFLNTADVYGAGRANARTSSLPPLDEALPARLSEFYAGNVAAHSRGPLLKSREPRRRGKSFDNLLRESFASQA